MLCENCKYIHNGSFGSGRFCRKECATQFAGKKNKGVPKRFRTKKKKKEEWELVRNCPLCSKLMYYKSESALISANERKCNCKKCAQHLQKEDRSKAMTGKGNHFYGKHHTEETKQKIRDNTDHSFTQTEEFKEKSKHIGKDNGNYGKNTHKVWYASWLEKYGKEEADKRMVEYKKKVSKNTSGKNNPMYGKPTPQGSGNGWSGWYKGWYFRSLLELSYMIKVIEKQGLKWESAEKKDLQILYKDWNGVERIYTADFLIDDKFLVEIKPIRLLEGSDTVARKVFAAQDFCHTKGLFYNVFTENDFPRLTKREIRKLRDSGEVKFLDRYDKKFSKPKQTMILEG